MLTDESKVDQTALEALDGVRKVMISSCVYQTVIGTDMADVFAGLEPLVGVNANDGDAPVEKKGVVNTVMDFVFSISMPIILVLSRVGMLKALLVVFRLIDNISQTYAILNFFSDFVVYFLPHDAGFHRNAKTEMQSCPRRHRSGHHDSSQLAGYGQHRGDNSVL